MVRFRNSTQIFSLIITLIYATLKVLTVWGLLGIHTDVIGFKHVWEVWCVPAGSPNNRTYILVPVNTIGFIRRTTV